MTAARPIPAPTLDDEVDRLMAALVRATAARMRGDYANRADEPRPVRLATMERGRPADPAALAAIVARGLAFREGGCNCPRYVATTRGLAMHDDRQAPLDLGPDPAARLSPSDFAQLAADLAAEGEVVALVEVLARRWGCDVDELWGELGSAEADGLLQRWPDHPMGPVATLSPWSAARLGLRVSADGTRFLRAGDRDPTEPTAGRAATAGEGQGDDQNEEHLVGERADPGALEGLDSLLLAELAEEAIRDGAPAAGPAPRVVAGAPSRDAARDRAVALAGLVGRVAAGPTGRPEPKLPTPLYLLGTGAIWPIMAEGVSGPDGRSHPWTPVDGPCRVCRGGQLGRLALCLVCLRSGIDALLPPVEPWMLPNAGRARGKGATLRGGTSKAPGKAAKAKPGRKGETRR